MKLSLLLAYALAAAPADTAAGPAEWAPPPALAARVAQAVAERWEVPAAAVRLEWPSTVAAPLDAEAPLRLQGTGTGGWWTVSLGAHGGGAAPARLRVRAGVESRVAVAAREVARGAVLEAEDVRVAPVTEWGPPRERGETPGAGWTARRLIASGEPLREPAVGPPLLVRSGEETEVLWSGGGVELKVRGAALGSASRGERVSVRIDTKRKLEGVAEAPGRVRIR